MEPLRHSDADRMLEARDFGLDEFENSWTLNGFPQEAFAHAVAVIDMAEAKLEELGKEIEIDRQTRNSIIANIFVDWSITYHSPVVFLEFCKEHRLPDLTPEYTLKEYADESYGEGFPMYYADYVVAVDAVSRMDTGVSFFGNKRDELDKRRIERMHNLAKHEEDTHGSV